MEALILCLQFFVLSFAATLGDDSDDGWSPGAWQSWGTTNDAQQLTERNIGQSTCIGIGGDPVQGVSFIEVLQRFNADPKTAAVVMIGEIGGTAEEIAAEYIRSEMKKPVVGFIGGQTAPPGKRMGHAGAIISGGSGKASDKIKALERAGVAVSMSPATIGETMARAISN